MYVDTNITGIAFGLGRNPDGLDAIYLTFCFHIHKLIVVYGIFMCMYFYVHI